MYIIKLYGTNTFQEVDSKSEILKTTIQGLADVESMQLSVNGLYYEKINEGEIYNSVGGKGATSLVYDKFNITNIQFNFNSSSYLTDLENFYTILGMKWKYLGIISYPHTLVTADYVVGIVINPDYEKSNAGGIVTYNLECYKRPKGVD